MTLGCLVYLISACASPPTLPPLPTPAAVRVLATDMTAPLLLDLAEAYAAAQKDVAVVPVLGAGEAPAAALAAGTADLALTIFPEPGLYATPLGYAEVAVVVAAENEVGPLSAAQVQALFAGEITDWAQVGGAAGPVQVVVPPAGTEAERLFTPAVMGAAAVGASALIAPSWEALREVAGEDPHLLAYTPTAELTPALRVVEQPIELRALVAAAALAEPAGPARDFLAWAQSAAGQAVVDQSFEPIE